MELKVKLTISESSHKWNLHQKCYKLLSYIANTYVCNKSFTYPSQILFNFPIIILTLKFCSCSETMRIQIIKILCLLSLYEIVYLYKKLTKIIKTLTKNMKFKVKSQTHF